MGAVAHAVCVAGPIGAADGASDVAIVTRNRPPHPNIAANREFDCCRLNQSAVVKLFFDKTNDKKG